MKSMIIATKATAKDTCILIMSIQYIHIELFRKKLFKTKILKTLNSIPPISHDYLRDLSNDSIFGDRDTDWAANITLHRYLCMILQIGLYSI